MQAGSASDAAAAQQQSAMAQLGLNSAVFNAQGAMSLPTREVGGLAQSREAYLLGLTPNLDISSDFSSPNITTTPSGANLGWNGPAGNDPNITGSTQPTSFGGQYYGAPSQPQLSNLFGSGTTPGGTATGGMGLGGSGAPMMTGMSASGPGAQLSVGGTPSAGGAPNGGSGPNAVLPGSSYGSFASPYNPSTFYQDPGYNFILGQGEQQIQNRQATTGLALSPSALTAALGYSSGLASNEFNNAYNRSMNTQTTQLNELNALSSGGQIATSGLSTAAGNFGAAGSSALAGYGNAGAAGAIGQGNAYSGMTNGLANAGMSYFNNQNNNGGYGFTPNNASGYGGSTSGQFSASDLNNISSGMGSPTFSTPA
jgi:hypothetical protein